MNSFSPMNSLSPLAYHAIGMFDSGLGGLTVLQAIQKILPYEKVVYFGDTARLPYGDKSPETILKYSIENAIFLMEQTVKILVVACNTASAVAIEKLKKIFNITVIGVIEPGAKKAIEVSEHGKIAILGTQGTIKSGAYQSYLKKLSPKAQVFPIACPLFVPFVEEGMATHKALDLIIQEYLKPLKYQSVDTILLGCTHYLALQAKIKEFIGKEVKIVDSASSCAEEITTILQQKKLLNPQKNILTPNYFVSDNPEKFRLLGRHFVNHEIKSVHLSTISAFNL